MNIKEQENQLALSLQFQIGLTIIFWLLMAGFIEYRLWASSGTQKELTIMNNVPTIKQSNLDILRTSLKSVSEINLSVVRPEPFNN